MAGWQRLKNELDALTPKELQVLWYSRIMGTWNAEINEVLSNKIESTNWISYIENLIADNSLDKESIKQLNDIKALYEKYSPNINLPQKLKVIDNLIYIDGYLVSRWEKTCILYK